MSIILLSAIPMSAIPMSAILIFLNSIVTVLLVGILLSVTQPGVILHKVMALFPATEPP